MSDEKFSVSLTARQIEVLYILSGKGREKLERRLGIAITKEEKALFREMISEMGELEDLLRIIVIDPSPLEQVIGEVTL